MFTADVAGLEIDIDEDESTSSCSRSNRKKARSGQSISLLYIAKYSGENINPPSAVWFMDGNPVRTEPFNEPVGNGRLESTLLFNFGRRDIGMYQCIFTSENGNVLLGTPAMRLDYGKKCWRIMTGLSTS